MFRSMCVFCLAFILSPLHSAVAGELLVSAAASLTNAFEEMKAPFEKANPGTTLVFNFAASGPLLQQMMQGAPVDVFASADQETMDKAGVLIDSATRSDFAGNSLVLITPRAETGITSVQDLQGEAVTRIALGNPESVPVGRYAKGALTALGVYDTLAPKFVLAENVRQALDYVVRAEVQAGFVYATDAAVQADKVNVVAEVPGHKPIRYPIAVVQASAQRELGQKFIDYVQSAEGQGILSTFGFSAP